jgi:hypothetical protein
MYNSIFTGVIWVQELLSGHVARFCEAFGMAIRGFVMNCANVAGFRVPCLTLAENVGVVLRICSPRDSHLPALFLRFGSRLVVS